MQRFGQRLLVAVPELNVRNGCLCRIQANGLADHKCDRFGLGLTDRPSCCSAALSAMKFLMSDFVRQRREGLGG